MQREESERPREREREAEEAAKSSCVVLVFFQPVEISCLLKARVFLNIVKVVGDQL